MLAEKVIYVFQSAKAVPYFAKRHLHLSERRPCKRGLIYSSPCTDLHCNPRKAVDSQPGFLNKNQNPTLHFRLLKAASAGEVFLCALAPPLPIPATTPRECAQPLRLLRRGQLRGTRAAPPLPAWLLSRRPARSWQGPTLQGPLRFQLATSPQYLQFAGKHAAGGGRGGRCPRTKQVA